MPIPPLAPLSRRALFAGSVLVAGAVMTGCDSEPDPGPAPSASTVPLDPLAAALARHVALRDLYVGAITARPSLAPRLAGLQAEVEQHVAALAAAMAQPPPSPPSPPASRSGTASATAASSAPASATSAAADQPADLLAALRAAEDAAGVELAQLVKTISAPRAPLVGSIAASCACHLVLLR